tara:strand:+ start:2736 stop:3632 length:897 start_codon:yes stop_codon:yes gene_type:complete
MPLPTTLYNNFNQGRNNLELSSTLMNPYAKWMQSPNIPRNTHLPIALENIESTIEKEPTVNEWFDQLESNNRKLHTPVPMFFPIAYHTSKYFSTIHRGELKWIEALLAADDKMFTMYSDNFKQKHIRELIVNVTNMFPKIYNHNVLRCYKQKKAQIYSSLFKNTTPAGLHMYSIYLDKNIIIMSEFGYEWCSLFSPFRDSICLWHHDGDVGTVLKSNGDKIDISDIISIKFDTQETRTKNLKIVSNSENLQKLRQLGKKNMNQLKNDAIEASVATAANGKPLKKQELIDSLLEQFMEH